MAVTNIFLAPCLPFLIEYLGLEVVNFGAIASIFFGSTITTIGMGYQNYFVLLVGRFFGGFGMELGYISAFTIMERHFKGNNLTLVNSLVAVSILSASAVSNFSTVRIFKKSRTIFIPSFIGSIICFLCTLLALCYYGMVYYYERKEILALEKESKIAEESELCKPKVSKKTDSKMSDRFQTEYADYEFLSSIINKRKNAAKLQKKIVN